MSTSPARFAPTTRHPDASWVEQQARNFAIHLDETGLQCDIILHDRDAKFTRRFDAILRQETGTRTMRLPRCSPNLNAYVERFVQTPKHECLNHFIIFGERHLNHLGRRVRRLLPHHTAPSGDRECNANPLPRGAFNHGSDQV